MKRFYRLQMSCDNIMQVESIKIIFRNHKCLENRGRFWVLEKQDKRNSHDYIGGFIKLLEGKYDALEKIGITRDMISIWYLYEYDQQCNMEFSPETMKKLADNGITFCISCWQA